MTEQAVSATHVSQSERAVRNTVSLLGSRIAIAAMGWAGTVVIARMLSPDEWGKFSFIFGVLGLMSVVTDLGVGRVVLARLVDGDEDEQRRLAGSFIMLRLMLGMVGYVVALSFVVLSGYPAEVLWATAVAGIVIVIATPSHALTVLYQSRLRLTAVAAAEMLGQLAQLVFTIVAALTYPALIVLVIPAIINEVVTAGVKLRGVRRGHAGPKPAVRAEVWRWKRMLVEAVPLSIGFAFVEMSSKIDLLLLSKLDDFDAVGLYSIGYKFADFVLIAALAVVAPFTTLMVAAWPRALDAFRESFQRAGAIIAVLAASGLAAFWPAADELLRLLYGDRFAQAALSTRLLVLGACLAALSQLGLMALVSAGRHRLYPWVSLGALTLNISLNLLLIPRFSYLGAAWATVASDAAMLIALGLVARFTIDVPRLLPLRAVGGAGCLAAMAIASTSLIPGLNALPWPLQAALNAAVTLVLAHAFGLTAGLSVTTIARRARARLSR